MHARACQSRRVVLHIDTRSVLRFSAFFYLTLTCIAFVAGVVLWLVATIVGIRGNVEHFIGELIASSKFHFVGWEVLRVSAIVAVVLIILGTAFNLFLAVVYNLISEIVGGMALIVDEEPVPMTVVPQAPALPASELAGLGGRERQAGITGAPGPAADRATSGTVPAAATPAEPPRAVARWVPKRSREI